MRKTITIAALFLATAAYGHNWYGWECCSGQDCRPIPVGDVKATSAGWQVLITGEVIAYGSKQIKGSKDESFHRCARSADFSAKGVTLCLYVPPAGV